MKEMARAAKIYGGEGKFVFWQKRNTKISDVDLVVNKYRFPVGVEWQGVFYEDEEGDNVNQTGSFGIRVSAKTDIDFGVDVKGSNIESAMVIRPFP